MHFSTVSFPRGPAAIACKVRDIPLPPGAIVNPDLIAEDAIYGCRATVSVRCRHAHDTSSRKLGRMQCHPNGSWIVPIREDQLHCSKCDFPGDIANKVCRSDSLTFHPVNKKDGEYECPSVSTSNFRNGHLLHVDMQVFFARQDSQS